MALALAARITREADSLKGRIERAFQLVYTRNPTAEESAASMAHLRALTDHHRAHPAPTRAQPAPIVHMITSELTGEKFQFTQQEDPEPYEHNLHPSDVPPETRALADLALVLLNSNEFVYLN
jgi:hypothetical protein